MSKMNSAPLSSLPTNLNSPLTQQDITLANHIFGVADSNVNRDSLAKTLKSPLIVAFLVAFMSHPTSSAIISKFYPKASENMYMMIAIKMIFAALAFFILNHWAFSRT